MSKVTRRLSITTLATLALIAGAQAATITYGGQAAMDGSGLTSAFVPASNIVNPATGYFIETFDPDTKMLGQGVIATLPDGITTSPVGDATHNIALRAGDPCSINTYNIVTITTTGGGFGVQTGGTGGVAANPAGDSTCFGYGPRPGGGTPATVKVNYATILDPGVSISYLGLYYGSIDDYNNIAFYNGDTLLTGAGILSDGIVTGAEIRAANGGPGNAGSWTAANSNVYINLFFDPSETFTAFEFRTTGVAFELDNVVVGLTNRIDVPEPGSMLLVALGLIGAATLSRRRKGIKSA